jgi:hypothetical protein
MTDIATTVARWTAGAAQGQQRYVEGVRATNVDVTGRAIAAQAKLLSGFQQAVTSGRWARKLSDVGTSGWKQATEAKANNYATGIAAGEQKYAQAMQTWLPRIQSAAQQVQSMPNATFQDSLNRMTAYATALHNAKLSS